MDSALRFASFARKAIQWLLLSLAFLPLLYDQGIFYPYLFTKLVFFRSAVTVALALAIIYFLIRLTATADFWLKFRFRFQSIVKNPLVIFFFLFLLSAGVSALFAPDKYIAFWGTLERGEGVYGFLHYFAFAGLLLAFFEKKEWLWFFKFSLITALVLVFYGFLQYFRVEGFPLALSPEARPGSFIGNPSFLSAYLILVFILSFFVRIWESRVWRIISSITLGLSLVMLFFSATRGALLGVFAGIVIAAAYYFFSGKFNRPLKIASGAILSLALIFGGIFWLTRTNDVWRRVPGLNRLAETTLQARSDASTETRVLTWGVSWKIFKEKPIFGWGPDNYLLAWNKHYDPRYSTYGDTWLDRAHNEPLDVLTMQGLLGMIAYLGIWFFIFYLVLKKTLLRHRFLIGAFLLAYLVQSFFLLREIHAYLLFMVIGSFLVFLSLDGDKESSSAESASLPIVSSESLSGQSRLTGAYLAGVLIVLALLANLIAFDYIPFSQGRMVAAAEGGPIASVKQNFAKATGIWNFAQPAIRGRLLDVYYDYQTQIFQKKEFSDFYETLMRSLDEVWKRQPSDIRFLIRKAQMLILRAQSLDNDQGLYREAEAVIREGLLVSSERQDLHYILAFSLANQSERLPEAIETVRAVIRKNPAVARSHFYLALFLDVQGSESRKEVLAELAAIESLDPFYRSLLPRDIMAIGSLYFDNGALDELAVYAMKRVRGEAAINLDQTYYEPVLRYFLAKRDGDNFIALAVFVGQEDPALKDNMDALIDLVQNEEWGILESL